MLGLLVVLMNTTVDGDDLSFIGEFDILVRVSCMKRKAAIWRDNSRHGWP